MREGFGVSVIISGRSVDDLLFIGSVLYLGSTCSATMIYYPTRACLVVKAVAGFSIAASIPLRPQARRLLPAQ